MLFAIGGNSLISDDAHITVEDQYNAVCRTTSQIARIIEAGNSAVITHGNGPQVGFILRRSEIASEVAHMHTVPLVSCDADTQGAIGYQIQQSLDNEFRKRDMNTHAVAIVTQVLVDEQDPAFHNPEKPIGQFYSKAEYEKIQRLQPEWKMKEEAGRGFRRVVASPMPGEIIEIAAIKTLLDSGFTVIAAGGGGIPVVQTPEGLKGIDAVVDKDRTSRLLATELGIDVLVISTGVSHVSANFGKSDQKDLRHVSLDEIKQLYSEGHFPPGNMGPKIEAAIRFIEAGGKEAIITSPDNLVSSVFEGTGTHIKA